MKLDVLRGMPVLRTVVFCNSGGRPPTVSKTWTELSVVKRQWTGVLLCMFKTAALAANRVGNHTQAVDEVFHGKHMIRGTRTLSFILQKPKLPSITSVPTIRPSTNALQSLVSPDTHTPAASTMVNKVTALCMLVEGLLDFRSEHLSDELIRKSEAGVKQKNLTMTDESSDDSEAITSDTHDP